MNIQNNPYLVAFNNEFKFNLEIRRADDLTEELIPDPKNNKENLFAVNIGEDYRGNFCEYYSIIPFISDENTSLYPDLCPEIPEEFRKVTKFQLIGYKHYSGTRINPPETVDFVIGNYDSFDSALVTALKGQVTEKINNLLTFIQESKMDEEMNNLEILEAMDEERRRDEKD